VVADFDGLGLLEKIAESIKLKVPRGERGNTVIEPLDFDAAMVRGFASFS